MTTQCPKGHEIRSQQDRDSQRYCARCRKEHNDRQTLKRKAAMDVCRGLEAYGVKFMDGDRPVTAEQVAEQLLKVYGSRID